jgi:predicted hydrolase (HD superfamily)
MITREQAYQIAQKHLTTKNLLKHCLAVEAAMKGLYRRLTPTEKQNEADETKWGIIGLLHDADWDACRDNPEKHTHLTIDWMKEAGETDEEMFKAILSHNYVHNGHNPPETPLEWALYTCDELTGFIVAVAFTRPDKKLATVTVESVLKKFPTKAFCAAVHREQILMCEEKLNIPKEDFVGIVLTSMQEIAPEMGL